MAKKFIGGLPHFKQVLYWNSSGPYINNQILLCLSIGKQNVVNITVIIYTVIKCLKSNKEFS